jgi:biopolymer transport protein ExbD
VPFQAPITDDTSGDEEPETGLFATINITPLTDVILVLLVTFMVSSSAMVDALREGTLGVNLPAAATGKTQDTKAETLVVGVTADGQVYVHDQVVDEGKLMGILTETKQKDARASVVVQADGDLQHKKVVHILDLVREAGFPDVGIGIKAEQ